MDTAVGGLTNADGITSNPEITGAITAREQVSQVFARLNEAVDSSLTDITGLIQPGGQFTLTTAELERILGTSLADGEYTLTVTGVGESNQGCL